MRKHLFTYLLLAGFLIPGLLQAQFSQEGPKLTGSGGINGPNFGKSVSLSADGNTAIIGGVVDNNGVGAAWIFVRSGGVWTQQGPKLVGSGNVGNSVQGNSVSLSADGNTAAVGGYGDNGNIGATWIFTRSGGVWTQQGQKLIGNGFTGTPRQGTSVSLSADGNTLIVGGPTDSTSRGAAWAFSRSGGVWSQMGPRLSGSGAYGFPSFGTSVSMSGDGNTAVIGGPSDLNGVLQLGATWIFVKSGNAWAQQGPKLVGSGYVGHSFQGYSVSISTDGNTVLSGGYYDNDIVGAAWIFTRSSGAWSQQGSKLVGDAYVGSAIFEGLAVSLSGDGNTAIIGGYGDYPSGASWIFTRTDTVWNQLGPKIVGSGSVGTSWQGISVAVSSNGTTFIVGGDRDNNDIGSAWAYIRSPFRYVNSHHNLHKQIIGNQITYDTSTIATNVISYFITNVNVTIDSIHYVSLGDLETTITHLYGADLSSSVTDTLIYQAGGSGANFIETQLTDSATTPVANGTAPFTGRFKPSHPLSLFNGIDPSGIWILKVYDRVTGHTGTLDAWTLTVDMAPSPIAVQNISQIIPKGFSLSQNYPNPFNPNTKIRFAIPSVGQRHAFDTRLTVYDILGREVATLVNENLNPGTYEVDFDGRKYASGVYFYTLKTENFTETKKMLMVK